jgi:hypothetical protein
MDLDLLLLLHRDLLHPIPQLRRQPHLLRKLINDPPHNHPLELGMLILVLWPLVSVHHWVLVAVYQPKQLLLHQRVKQHPLQQQHLFQKNQLPV